MTEYIMIFLIFFLPIILTVAIFAIPLLVLLLMWRRTQKGNVKRKIWILVGVLVSLAWPFVANTIYGHWAVLARVPKPLQVAIIEYRLEKAWGSGPGGNETGFVVYRLTESSSQWAKEQGSRLGEALPGGSAVWAPTPVDDTSPNNKWHPYDDDPQMMSMARAVQHPPTVIEFLEKYGFDIPIESGRTDEADTAIQTPGSFYMLGSGGSATIVDPSRGKVYFFYAG